MSEIKLKRCPFCGGEMEIIYKLPVSPLLSKQYHFACKNMCITSRKGYETKDEAIKTCNTRKQIERIEDELNEELDYSTRNFKDEELLYRKGIRFARRAMKKVMENEQTD